MQLVDSDGHPIHLGKSIGKGGEGIVLEVEGEPKLAAKVYHQKPLTEAQFLKLDAMVRRGTPELSRVAAWPMDILRIPGSNDPCGLLMPKIDRARQLHELYGTTNRRLHFPEVRWHHLLLAARNLAAAFHTLHEQGMVVGDVNQGNLMVNKQYNIHFIDCDSFQISDGEHIFRCPVGTPHFTPPELQSQHLGDIPRTQDHDAFGLAVLIFHLIFVGRHPFAGRFRGEGDLLIEQAIAERRFAFSRDKDATMVEPPPYSLQLDDLPPELASLFEAALRTGGVNGTLRPTPEQWVQQLDALMTQRAACDLDSLHIYYNGLKKHCPWCRIEDEGGPSFFVQDSGASFVSDGRLAMLDSKINALRPVEFPDLPPSQITPPTTTALKQTGERPKITPADVAAHLFVVAGLLCLGGIWSWIPLVIGCVLALGAGAYLALSPLGKARREKLKQFEANLDHLRRQMVQAARATSAKHQQRKRDFDANMAELRETVQRYVSEGDDLKNILREQTGEHKKKFLRGFMLRDHVAEIPGLTATMIPILESYGVESALDVHKLGVYGVPIINSDLALEMLQWRELIESRFEFKPEHGITTDDLERYQQVATERFKIAQARKILMGARHLESLAAVGQAALQRSGCNFETLSSQWKAIAREKGKYQQSRTLLERTINQSEVVIVCVALAIPVVGGLVTMILG